DRTDERVIDESPEVPSRECERRKAPLLEQQSARENRREGEQHLPAGKGSSRQADRPALHDDGADRPADRRSDEQQGPGRRAPDRTRIGNRLARAIAKRPAAPTARHSTRKCSGSISAITTFMIGQLTPQPSASRTSRVRIDDGGA